jgi:GTPase
MSGESDGDQGGGGAGLIDRYFKTTLYGLSGCAPDYVMLMVGGNAGLIGMSKEHLGVALALNVPIAVCVTKVS